MSFLITEWVTVLSSQGMFLMVNTGYPNGEQSQILYTLPTVGSWFKQYWYVLFVLILFIVICLVTLVLSIVRWRRLVGLRKEGTFADEDHLYTSAGVRDRRSDSALIVRSMSRASLAGSNRNRSANDDSDSDSDSSSSSSDSDSS